MQLQSHKSACQLLSGISGAVSFHSASSLKRLPDAPAQISLCVLLAKVNSILLFLFILTRHNWSDNWDIFFWLAQKESPWRVMQRLFFKDTQGLTSNYVNVHLETTKTGLLFYTFRRKFCTPAKYVMSCQHWVKNGHECPIHMNGFLYKSTLLSKWLSKWPEALHVSACEESPECSSHMSKLDFTRFTPHSYHVTVAVRFHSRHVLKHTYSPFLQTFSSCDGTHF